MAISKKMQEVFDWYVDNRPKDVYEFSSDLDESLKLRDINMNSAEFVAAILNELDLGQLASNWKPWPDNKRITIFLESLPRRFIKDWWSLVSKYVPEEKWEKFKQKIRSSASFIDFLESDEPVILVNENKKKDLIFSVYLGNIIAKLGLTEDDLKHRYDDVYDAIENELGHKAISAHIPSYLSVIDWPNASTLENAKYEFLVKSQVDPAIGDIENSLIVALSKLGLK